MGNFFISILLCLLAAGILAGTIINPSPFKVLAVVLFGAMFLLSLYAVKVTYKEWREE